MIFPEPQPGLVIRYSYLWKREADEGQEEGSKDRPCAIILCVTHDDGEKTVVAVPITHTPPQADSIAIEIPQPVKLRLGLDEEQSWVVLDEANRFSWPGPDLRFVPGSNPSSASYGFLPDRFFQVLREKFYELAQEQKAKLVGRTE